MTETFPYRHRAEDGLYAGTTFIYYEDGSAVTYSTRNPVTYWITPPRRQTLVDSASYPMTPSLLRQFEGIPLTGPEPRSRIAGAARAIRRIFGGASR